MKPEDEKENSRDTLDDDEITEKFRTRNSEGRPTIQSKELLFHFVMTDDKYIKRYCTCLMIYVKIIIS